MLSSAFGESFEKCEYSLILSIHPFKGVCCNFKVSVTSAKPCQWRASKASWSRRDVPNDLQYQPERRLPRRRVRQVTELHRLVPFMAILGSFHLVTGEQCRCVKLQMISLLLDQLGSRKATGIPSPQRNRQ